MENIPVLAKQDHLAVAGAVVLDCRPPLLPVSMDIGDLVGLICPELGVAPLVDPGTDLEDELPTPVGSLSPDVDKSVPLSTSSGVDLELVRAHLEVGVLPAMVTPIVDPEVGSSMTPAGYPVPRFRSCRWWFRFPLGVASPARPDGGGSSARNESLLGQVSPLGSVAQAVPSPTSPVLRSGFWFGTYGVFRCQWRIQRIPLCFRLPHSSSDG